jgi:hypothetical protein
MWSPRHTVVSLFFGILAATWLFGCRAFEPEAVIVNKPPETYIIGSPAETTGAYFHYHVYWYGADDDGVVERFVWALTDTSIQDPRVIGDEEDENFNPATNISTLARGHYTARTDSVFDFRINQGAVLSADMTLHMVAIDDRGDFDRTPARLHFFSNALGHPHITFYRDVVSPQTVFANFDTIAYREPLTLVWRGGTPNTAAYEPDLLARADTVPRDLPEGTAPDGLLGFKWFAQGVEGCDPSQDGCWYPRREREPGSTDSVSYFSDVSSVVFHNDGSGSLPYGRVLDSGITQLLVNTIDVAGVQIPVASQALNIVVNYQPDTYILRNESPGSDDPQRYPYYVVFHGAEQGTYSFSEGDTVPDGAYVVFMAKGWDDRRDAPFDPCPPGNPDCDNHLRFQGNFTAVGYFRGTSPFRFSATYSDAHQTIGDNWTVPHDPYATSRDTIGFEVGPFTYEVEMRAVDNRDWRDGTPDEFTFQGNFPPCIQCIELLNAEPTTHPTVAYEDGCYDQSCLTTPTVLRARNTSGPVSPTDLSLIAASDTIWVNPDGNDVRFTQPVDPTPYKYIRARHFSYVVYLHGKNPPREEWPHGQADRRIGSWYYQIDYSADQANIIRDGSGADYIRSVSGFDLDANDPNPRQSQMFIVTDPSETVPYRGAWGIPVEVGVPQTLQTSGAQAYWDSLLTAPRPDNHLGGFGAPPAPPAGSPPEMICAWQADPAVQRAYRAWQLTTMQFTTGSVQAIASDVGTCDWRPRTNMYHYYQGVRIPPAHGRECTEHYYQDADHREAGVLDLGEFFTLSNRGEPVVKPFEIVVETAVGDFQGGSDPPGWIPCGKKAARGWR